MKKSNANPSKRMLLIGAYGMEMVECGGTLHKNVLQGGVSHAVIAFADDDMRKDLLKAAEILQVTIDFLGLSTSEISANVAEKKLVVRAIRAFQPDIIITQDTEHSMVDLDPGRRPFMTLALESISLAGRGFALDEPPVQKPFDGATLYFMTPSNPNCLVDIMQAWGAKCAAMDILKTQLEFSAQYYEQNMSENELRVLVPNWFELPTYLEKGKAAKRSIDLSTHMFYGACGHSHTVLSEAFRKAELFELENLLS